MPSFITKGGRHFVSYITGPSHVLLGIKFFADPVEPTLVKQPKQGSGSQVQLDEVEIRSSVLEVLAVYRAKNGASLYAAEIVYMEDDTPNYALFGYVAGLLVERYGSGREFDHVA